MKEGDQHFSSLRSTRPWHDTLAEGPQRSEKGGHRPQHFPSIPQKHLIHTWCHDARVPSGGPESGHTWAQGQTMRDDGPQEAQGDCPQRGDLNHPQSTAALLLFLSVRLPLSLPAPPSTGACACAFSTPPFHLVKIVNPIYFETRTIGIKSHYARLTEEMEFPLWLNGLRI